MIQIDPADGIPKDLAYFKFWAGAGATYFAIEAIKIGLMLYGLKILVDVRALLTKPTE